KYIGVWTDDVERRWIECLTMNNGAVIHGIPPKIDEEGGALPYWTAGIAAVLLQKKWGLLLRIRISRIPEVVRDIEAFGAVELICPGLGQDLDPSCADLVVLRRKWVLIDADLAYGGLLRHLAVCKTIDED